MTDAFVPLGLLFFLGFLLSLLFRKLKQSPLIALICAGIFAGFCRGMISFPRETLDVFTEIGIILLLFNAGLELNLESVKKHGRIILFNSIGQVLINGILGILFGMLMLGLRKASTLLFFTLCLSFSSTIICVHYLKYKKEQESFHGQIIMGLLAVKDIMAALSLIILKSLEAGQSVLAGIGQIGWKTIIFLGILWISQKTFLPRLFRLLATAKELLFIGTLGWVFGIAAICRIANYSSEIGAFMAGAILSLLPYRLEVQDKVEPQKDFGIFLLFIGIGFNLEISRQLFGYLIPILMTAFFVLLVTPLVMLFLGYLGKLKSRPTFFIGMIINQISEFSLVLSTLCMGAGIFDRRTFTIMTFSCVATMVFSSILQQTVPYLYRLVKGKLVFLDKRGHTQTEIETDGFHLDGHVVLLTYNELTEQLILHFGSENILLIDIDPDIIDLYDRELKNVHILYADIFDPDTWEEAKFDKASIIVSCLVKGQEAEISIARWLADHHVNIPFIAASDSRADAIELYENGISYVIETEDMAAEYTRLLFSQNKNNYANFFVLGQRHFESLRERCQGKLFKYL